MTFFSYLHVQGFKIVEKLDEFGKKKGELRGVHGVSFLQV